MKERVGAALGAVLVGLLSFFSVTAAYATSDVGAVTPYSATEIINPQRGQFENLMTGLFPQTNPAQSAYPAWPGTQDEGQRYNWSQLEPTDPSTLPGNATDAQKYDFSAIDADIASAAAQGKRFDFRVMAFVDTQSTGGVSMAVPSWLRGLNGATTDYTNNGTTYVIPDWNNSTYLNDFDQLIAALGRRYDHDERVEWYEFSGYGDFSENHNAFMRDTLGMPGPSPANSVAQLGYYSQYGDQYITQASIANLVSATLQAFPDTQILTTTQNPEITKQLLRDSPDLANIQKPVGVRADCLGVYSPPQTWATDQYSYYVQNNDPIIPILLDRWKAAPVATEWCNWVPTTEQAYFDQALSDTVNYHVSEIASTGQPYQWSGTQMPSNLFDEWARTAKYSGYRYAMTASTVPDTATIGDSVPISVQWTNFGVAPTYDDWQVQYQIRDASNNVVKTVNSSLNLKTLYATQNYTDTSADPNSQSTTDSTSLPTTGLAAGTYKVYAQAVWNEHKSGGTNTVTLPNLNFAQADVNNEAYPVGDFTLVAAQSTQSSAPSSSTTVPGTPNTGSPRSSLTQTIALSVIAGLVVLGVIGLVFYRRMTGKNYRSRSSR